MTITTDETAMSRADATIEEPEADEALTPLQAALLALQAARERMSEVEGQLGEYRAQMATVEAAITPERALDDPEGTEEDAARADALRRRVTLSESALVAGRERVERARSVALLAEADTYAPAVAEAQARLDAHAKKTEKLRAALVTHTREYWAAAPLAVDAAEQHADTHLVTGRDRVTWTSHEERLHSEVKAAEAVVEALRGLAEGRPVTALTYGQLPECLQRGGWADLGWETPDETHARATTAQLNAALSEAHRFAMGAHEAALRAAADVAQHAFPQWKADAEAKRERFNTARRGYLASRERMTGQPGVIDPGGVPNEL